MSDLKERWLSKKLAAFVLASLLLWLAWGLSALLGGPGGVSTRRHRQAVRRG